MQTSTTFNWGRVVTPLRWVARVLGIVLAGILAVIVLLSVAAGDFSFDPIFGYVTWGLMFVGILIAAFWEALGEAIGGSVTVTGAILTFAFVSVSNWGSLAVLAPFIIVGLMFIACGWYTLAQRSRHAMPTPA